MQSGPAADASAWVRRFAPLIRPRGTVLDVACGSGRHVRWLHEQGFVVTAIDRDADAVAPLRDIAEVVVADLETGAWPLPGRRFDAVVVTHYLWRPLFAHLRAALAEGGALIYETFAAGQQTVGRPSRPAFLLQPGELLEAVDGFQVVAYENGFLDHPARFVQRIAAVKPSAIEPAPPRHALNGA